MSSQSDSGNLSNPCNPNNDKYLASLEEDERPVD